MLQDAGVTDRFSLVIKNEAHVFMSPAKSQWLNLENVLSPAKEFVLLSFSESAGVFDFCFHEFVWAFCAEGLAPKNLPKQQEIRCARWFVALALSC